MDRPKTIHIGNFQPPKVPSRTFGILLGLLALILILFSMVYQIDPEEAGLVMRFGKYVRKVEPGIQVKFPAPIERVIKVPVERQQKEEFGFRTATVGVRSTYSERDLSDESLMLTGDLNVAEVEWITQYRIRDPYLYTFKVRRVTDTFRDMNEAVMREIIGDRSVNEVLTIGRQAIASEVETRLQELCDQYETGIKIEQVVLQDVNPPDPVKPSFNEVNQAQQEKERMINDAMSDFNRVIPRARGEALQTIQQAEGYATDRVNRAKGDAVLFRELLAAYRESPEVTRRRIYLETMDAVFPKVQRKVVIDSKAKNVLPLLNLQQEVGK